MQTRGSRSIIALLSVTALFIVGLTSSQDAIAHRLAAPRDGSSDAAASEEVYVPAGEYVRGCTGDTVGAAKCSIESKPLQAVYLDAFYIDRTEVTNVQYGDCVNAGVCEPPLSSESATRAHYYGNPTFADYPVIHVDWDRADTYCRWLGKRLPTEAEWEKAARGEDHPLFPWGNEFPTCDKCNCNTWYYNAWGERREAPCVGDTAPVGSYEDSASPYGVYDMVGNVREWVNDLYEKYYFVDSPYYNPSGPASTVAGEHLVRGGSWKDTYTHGNTWVRLDEADIYQTHLIGFRCARLASSGSPPPIPTSTPEPTATPFAAQVADGKGGAVWLPKPDHLTLVQVPAGSLSYTTAITLTYTEAALPGSLSGIGHTFRVEALSDAPEDPMLPGALETPVEIALVFPEDLHTISGTLELYRLDHGVWITEGITGTQWGSNYLNAYLRYAGVYAMLGSTNSLYLPLMVR